MTETEGKGVINLKWFGTLNPKQILALVGALIVSVILTVFGFSSSCLGMLLIAVILYMVPNLMGVKNIQLMAVFGIIFFAVALPIGAFVTAPGLVENNDSPPSDNDYFKDVSYEYTEDGVVITATLVNPGMSGNEVYFNYEIVVGIAFGNGINTQSMQHMQLTVTVTEGVATATGTLTGLDPNKLYLGNLSMSENEGGEEVVIGGSGTYQTFLTGAYEGSITSLALYGCAFVLIYILILYYAILFLTFFMRGRFEKSREKMEAEGRLYPQGYGRCKKCGSIVLPGEINCRKCGEYIDRPEEMKPKKKDFFECSECGSEVPGDAAECPKCGAKFEEDEVAEVTHSDGTVETTNEMILCPECGGRIPSASKFCPRCGATFKKK